MHATARTTLTASALILGMTSVGLIRVLFHLRAIHANLAATVPAVREVADATSAVPDRLTSVNASLKPVRDFCASI